ARFAMQHGCPTLDPFDPVRAEHAVWLEHQHEDHKHIGCEILGAAADIGVEVASRQTLDHADDQSADHRTDDGIKAAQDHNGKHLEPNQCEVHVDAKHAAPDHAAKCRYRAGHGPGEREITLNID